MTSVKNANEQHCLSTGGQQLIVSTPFLGSPEKFQNVDTMCCFDTYDFILFTFPCYLTLSSKNLLKKILGNYSILEALI